MIIFIRALLSALETLFGKENINVIVTIKTSQPTTIQLIVVDIDGTLFNSRQLVSAKNITAIESALSSGVQVALASGRGRLGITQVLDLIGLDLPFTCSAGAGVFNGKSSAPIHLDLIPTDDQMIQVLRMADKYDLGWIADLSGGFLWKGDERLTQYMDPFSRQSMREDDRITDLAKMVGKEVLKISFFTPQEVREVVKAAFSEMHAFETVYAGLNYIDLTKKGVNKGTALKTLATALNVPVEATAAIGDQEIDLSMFAESGISVAMGNAPALIRDKADMVAPNNDEDGVAWAISKLLKKI